MEKKKLFVVSQPHYAKPFEDFFEITDSIYKADVALFTGGEDVTPRLYGEVPNSRTYSNVQRDIKESAIHADCMDYKIKCLGICRGAQFLTVKAGGSLIQHVTNHGVSHEVFTNRNKTVVLSSTHHQMMNPFGLDKSKFELIGWSEGISTTYLNGENNETLFFKKEQLEPEIVYYPETMSLCIQAHPEIMNINSKGVEFVRQLVKEYLL